MENEFLYVSKAEMLAREVYECDFIVVSGDCYVDHPSFGHALIGRLAQSQGFEVGMIAQPTCDDDYLALGEPKHAFLVTSGVVDSMVNNYSVALRRRENDVYSEDGVAGKRPDRALQVYCHNLKRLFPNTPIIIGGIEASLRRLAHYDYWSDSVRQSILIETGADLAIYGMGENPLMEICNMAHRNIPLNKVKNIRGTAYAVKESELSAKLKSAIESKEDGYILLSSYARVASDSKLYCKAFVVANENTDAITAKTLLQKQDNDTFVVVNTPALPLTEKQMDSVYALPFLRKVHPMYHSVPAIEEVEHSVTAHRGCFGNCSFCALTYHQGRVVQSRSTESIISEVENIVSSPTFKGYISDIGGPSANFHEPSCEKQLKFGVCKDKQCIGYERCPNLKISHEKYLDVLRKARSIKGVKKVFVRSGLRFDYLMADKDKTFFDELVKYHISGQLKVAPEHCCDNVLKAMNKPRFAQYLEFVTEYEKLNKVHNLKQFIVPYFISSHPGCTLADAVKLTDYLKSINYMPKQVQDFYPTPSTLATTMYYTELDPYTLEKVYVAKSKEEKAMQRALLQYRLPQNKLLIEKALAIVEAGEKGKKQGEKTASKSRNGKTSFDKPAKSKTPFDKSAKEHSSKSGGFHNGKRR